MWGGREGVEADAAKDVRSRSTATPRRSTCAASTSASGATTCASRSSPSPTSPAATCSCPRSATPWPSSASSSGPTWWASTPSSPTRRCRAQLHPRRGPGLWHGKLFHIDLNAQRIGKFDQDFRFGSEGIRDAFYLVKLLEDSGWDGMRHFDAHAYRTEDADGVWDFARGCMRTYLILKEKAERLRDDPEIQEALQVARPDRLPSPPSPGRARRRCRAGEPPRPRRGRAGRAGLRPRAARPAGHRAAARRPLMPLVAGVDSSTSACKVEVRDADTASSSRPGRAPHPPTTPPRSEQDPADVVVGVRGRLRQAGVFGRTGPTPSRSPASSTAWSCSTTPGACCGRRSCGTTPSRHPTPLSWSTAPRCRPRGPRPAAACRWRASPSPSCTGCAAPSPTSSPASPGAAPARLAHRPAHRRPPPTGATRRAPAGGRRRGALPHRPARARRPGVDVGLDAARGARGRPSRPASGRPPGGGGGPGTGDNMAAALGSACGRATWP
jgi:hypothetical protein